MTKFKKFLDLEDFLPESRLVIDEYFCSLCQGIYNHPIVDDCGHVFCQDCLSQYLKFSSICPISQTPLKNKQTYAIKFISNILDKQLVYCKKRKNGCQWVGKLAELEHHLKEDCLKNTIKCKNPGCEQEVLREDEDNHNRLCEFKQIPCKDCNIPIIAREQEQHSKVCLKCKIECPQGCGEVVEREALDNHLQNLCENTIVKCLYHSQGCNEKIKKKDMSKHMKEKYEEHQFFMFKRFDDFDETFKTRTASLEKMYDKFTKRINALETLIIDNKDYIVESTGLTKKPNLASKDKDIKADKHFDKPEKKSTGDSSVEIKHEKHDRHDRSDRHERVDHKVVPVVKEKRKYVRQNKEEKLKEKNELLKELTERKEKEKKDKEDYKKSLDLIKEINEKDIENEKLMKKKKKQLKLESEKQEKEKLEKLELEKEEKLEKLKKKEKEREQREKDILKEKLKKEKAKRIETISESKKTHEKHGNSPPKKNSTSISEFLLQKELEMKNNPNKAEMDREKEQILMGLKRKRSPSVSSVLSSESKTSSVVQKSKSTEKVRGRKSTNNKVGNIVKIEDIKSKSAVNFNLYHPSARGKNNFNLYYL